MTSICIGYLTDNRRTYTFEKFIYFLNKVEQKEKIHLLLLINNISSDFFDHIIKANLTNVNYTILSFPNENNYINKIKTFINFTQKNNMKYCMKFDNDLIVNNYTFDFMIENVALLENKENLFITPTLSSGIPTTDYFIEDFFNVDEKDHLHNLFLKTTMPNNLWGFNYDSLNDYTIKDTKWDAEKFINKLNELNYFYKGIHPIRINKEAIEYMNTVILKYKHKIHEKQDYKIQINKNFSYLCNSIFLIDVNNYEKLVNDQALYVDPFDEVPVNKFCQLHNLNGIFIRNSFSIHPIYNTIPNHHIHEKQFYDSFFI
jgi:hypothetical protein